MRLVHLDRAVDHLAVDQHLVARAQLDRVADDQFFRRDRPLAAVAHDRAGRPCQQRDLVQHPLRADFLHNADDDVRHDDADGDHRIHRPPDEDEADAQQKIALLTKVKTFSRTMRQ